MRDKCAISINPLRIWDAAEQHKNTDRYNLCAVCLTLLKTSAREE